MNDSRGDERKTHVGLYDGGGGGLRGSSMNGNNLKNTFL